MRRHLQRRRWCLSHSCREALNDLQYKLCVDGCHGIVRVMYGKFGGCVLATAEAAMVEIERERECVCVCVCVCVSEREMSSNDVCGPA